MRTLPVGIHAGTPEHFLDHQTSRVVLAPTPEAMAQLLNASDIDPEEKMECFDGPHREGGPRIENPECFDA